MVSSTVYYELDRADCICSVNAAWDAFALENASPHLVRESIVGQSIWQCIDNVIVKGLYRDLVGRARLGTEPLAFSFRCDSPNVARHLRMTIQGLPDEHVSFSVETLNEVPRARPFRTVAATGGMRGFLVMCSVCKAINIENDWTALDEAIERLGIFLSDEVHAVSHGICPNCYTSLIESA